MLPGASKGSAHRSVSDGTHFPIQRSGVERAGEEVITYCSLKKLGGRWKLRRFLLGSSAGQRDGWKDCCHLLGLGKVVTAVNMLLKSTEFHILIYTTTSFTKKWNMLSKSPTWILLLQNQSSCPPGINWHALKQQTLLIHPHNMYH